MYDTVHGYLPDSVTSLFDSQLTGTYPITRHRNDPRLPNVKSDLARRSVLYRDPLLWLNMDLNLKSIAYTILYLFFIFWSLIFLSFSNQLLFCSVLLHLNILFIFVQCSFLLSVFFSFFFFHVLIMRLVEYCIYIGSRCLIVNNVKFV